MKHTIYILFLLVVLAACNPLEQTGVPPIASFKTTPINGKTTDTIYFDASTSIPGVVNNKAYYRWDWDHDGIWDSEYSRIPVTGHRYIRKGTFSPLLSVINSDGLVDTLSVPLSIIQGYSPPKPSFVINPLIGNLKTRFIMDASSSRDDEDSTAQLLFMWDFTGNGSWDTPLSANPTAITYYQDTGRFNVALQVVDPQNLRSIITREIWVTDINPRLLADFTQTPEYGTTDTYFVLDASVSRHLDEPTALFRYSWKLPPTYAWSPWSYKPDTSLRFLREDSYDLEMRIMDTASLLHYCKKTIRIYHQNLPPNPRFIIGCRRGNIRTQFFFSSWPTLDQESLPTTLEVRWDFNGDQQWDTEYSKERTIYHNYTKPGSYKVYLEARDPDGLSDTTAQFVEVSPWTNETGLIQDQRDGQYYGSVKIGEQWWMSQNLNFEPFDSNKDEVEKWCYSRYLGDPIPWCNKLGGLYNCYHATREDFYGEVRGICPMGWHMPSRKEWEQLVGYIGGWNESEKLLEGGSTDFNALFAGCMEIVQDPENGSTEAFKWINYATYFWSFNKMSNPWAPNSWSLALINGEKKFYPGFSGMNNYYSVRCIKNEE